MTPDNKYSKVLLELKTKYEQRLAELETQASQIKARLTSLNTLIDDPLLGSDILSVLQGEADSLTSTAPNSNGAVATEPKAEAKTKTTAPKASPSSSKKKPSTSKKATSQARKKKKTQKKTSSASSTTPPMKKPYTEMFKIDAVAQIMQEKAGNSVHIDDLILQLYGELSGDDLKAERKRIKKTMYDGVRQNRWRKDPEESTSYIFEKKSEAKSKKT